MPCSVPDMHIVLCHLAQGRRDEPGTHPIPVRVVVLEGEGLFILGPDLRPYRGGSHGGSRFEIPANTLHGFARTDTPTFFVKKWRVVRTQSRSALIR